MARRPHPAPPASGARRAARLVLAVSVLAVSMAAAPLAAGADEAPATTPTLSEVLLGQVDGLSAAAVTTPMDEGDIGVVVEVTNDGDDAVEVAIPFGTLVVTETEGDQALTVTAPPTDEVVEVAAGGGTPTLEVEPGTSRHDLPAYCTELGDGYPLESQPVTPIDAAHPVLADTLRAATVAEADHGTTQDAVWWLTDEPFVPVDGAIAGLLEVDAAAFAAAPHRVTPDTGYTPMWMRDEVPAGDGGSLGSSPYDEEEAAAILDESFEGPTSPASSTGAGGVGAGPIAWAVLVGLVVVTSVIVATRAGRGQSAPSPALVRTAPGWYPDPWGGGGHRYWDGQSWTTRVMGPR